MICYIEYYDLHDVYSYCASYVLIVQDCLAAVGRPLLLLLWYII